MKMVEEDLEGFMDYLVSLKRSAESRCLIPLPLNNWTISLVLFALSFVVRAYVMRHSAALFRFAQHKNSCVI